MVIICVIFNNCSVVQHISASIYIIPEKMIFIPVWQVKTQLREIKQIAFFTCSPVLILYLIIL